MEWAVNGFLKSRKKEPISKASKISGLQRVLVVDLLQTIKNQPLAKMLNRCMMIKLKLVYWPVGLMDKASASGAGDSRFESWAGQLMCGVASTSRMLEIKALIKPPVTRPELSVGRHGLSIVVL